MTSFGRSDEHMVEFDVTLSKWRQAIERSVSGERWRLKWTFILFGLALFCHFPHYNYLAGHLSGTEINPRWDAIMEQAKAPLTFHRFDDDPTSHLEKIAFRLTVPALSFLTGLGPLGLFLLQNVLGLVLVRATLGWCERRLGDRVASLMFTGVLVFTYAGAAFFFDLWGMLDCFGYFLLFAMLVGQRWWLIGLCGFLAAFTDERACLAVLIGAVFHATEAGSPGGYRLKVGARSLACLGAIAAYVLSRMALVHYAGFVTGQKHLGLLPFLSQLDQVAWGVWSGFEGAWLLITAFFIVLWATGHRAIALGYLFSFGIVAAAAIAVWDVTRSMAFGFILLYPAVMLLAKLIGMRRLRVLLFFSLAVCLLHPMYFTFGDAIVIPVDPVPIRALHVLEALLK